MQASEHNAGKSPEGSVDTMGVSSTYANFEATARLDRTGSAVIQRPVCAERRLARTYVRVAPSR